MANVNVVYNERQEPLEVLLRTIDRPGDYCLQDRLLAPMPRVDVEGAHSLSFPITEGQAGSLAAAAEPAPYGRGGQTLLDRSVRACGQIDAARVRTLDDLGDLSDWNEPRDDREDLAEDEIASTRQILGLVASDGARPDYGELPLLPGELLPAGALDGAVPDDDDYTATGNEGVQVSRSYRRAALVLWPRERTVGTLAGGGIERAVAWFADDLARCENDTGSRRRLAGLAAQLELADRSQIDGR